MSNDKHIFVVELETDRFTFQGFGGTASEAEAALLKGLNKHGRDFRLPRNWHDAYWNEEFPVHPQEISLGSCLRDGETID